MLKAMHNDHEFNPEERLKREQDEELARRIRREVRRVQSGEADPEIEEEIAQEEAEKEEKKLSEERAKRRAASPLRGIFTGNILRQEWLTGHYRYPLIIAAVFLLSIIVMFWSLRLDMTLSREQREVQLLREKAVRLSEQRNRITTHSAVVEELRRRGIPLEDPIEPTQKID